MTADKLSIFQGALRVLGERRLSALTDDTPSRYVLDGIWDSNVRDVCLMEGFWHFALRTVQIDSTGDITPDFGYVYAFEKPSDWLRTAAISLDSYFNTPLNQYADEAGYWFADQTRLYIKYISNGDDYGGDVSSWPVNFARYVEAYMAAEGAERITQNRVKKGDIVAIAGNLLTKAKSTDAMNQPVSFPPRGSWASARMNGRAGRLGRFSGGWEKL